MVDPLNYRFLVKVYVQDATSETKFVIFDYEGNKFFKLSASQLYEQNGKSHNTTPELMMQLLADRELNFKIKLPSYISAYPQTEYTVSRILDEQLTPPSPTKQVCTNYLYDTSSHSIKNFHIIIALIHSSIIVGN